MILGDKLLKLRKREGLSQEEVGEKLGVSRQTVSKWETNQTMPELSKVKLLSELYKIGYDSLMNELQEEDSTGEVLVPSDEIDWTKIWSKEYPILETYPRIKGIEAYNRKVSEVYDEFKSHFKFSDQDTVLILKDMLYKKFQKSKKK